MKNLLCVLIFGMMFGQVETSETVYEEPNPKFYSLIIGWFNSGLLDNCNVYEDGFSLHKELCYDEDCEAFNCLVYQKEACYTYQRMAMQAMDCVFLKENSPVIINLQSQINDIYEIINDDSGDENGDGWDDVCYEAGAESGDANGDGELNILDLVVYANEILNG